MTQTPAGAWVFPGGRLDDDDYPPGAAPDDPEALLVLRVGLEEAGFDEQFQVTGDARLTLSQHVDVVADGQVFPCRQRQNAQPRVFRRCAQ